MIDRNPRRFSPPFPPNIWGQLTEEHTFRHAGPTASLSAGIEALRQVRRGEVRMEAKEILQQIEVEMAGLGLPVGELNLFL